MNAQAQAEAVETAPAPLPVPTMQAPPPSTILAEWSPEQVAGQLEAIRTLMQKSMQKDEDFGVIPGCKKPSLLKPGAEKLGLMFRLAPSYDVKVTPMEKGHREIVIVCMLTHIPTGRVLGSGLGSCSTMEAKYRWRQKKSEDEPTDKQVPKEFWNRRNDKKDPASPAELQGILAKVVGAPGRYGTKKIDEVWMITKKGERTEEREENPDLADQYNTVLKMAKKRAHVDAALTVTAASQIFTQDVEENAPASHEEEAKPTAAAEEPGEVTEVRTKAMACATLQALSTLKKECQDKAGPWWTKAVNDVLNARYFEITGKVAPNEPA